MTDEELIEGLGEAAGWCEGKREERTRLLLIAAKDRLEELLEIKGE